MFTLPSSPSVRLLETPLHADPAAAETFLSQWLVAQAAGLPWLGRPAQRPRPALIVATLREREAVLALLLSRRCLSGIPDHQELPLRVLGRGNSVTGEPLFDRVQWAWNQDHPELILFLDAEQTPGVGFERVGRSAWGLSAPWGPGRQKTHLGWQHTWGAEWSDRLGRPVTFLNHFTVGRTRLYDDETEAFRRSSDAVYVLKPTSRHSPRHRLTGPDTDLVVKRTRAGLWVPLDASVVLR